MEIPQNVQDKLKCSNCDDLLSCGPVFLLHATGGTICGRCSQHSEDSTESDNRSRNESYEATASLFSFPCAFASRGCPEKFTFSMGPPPHELNCKFRPFICPIGPRGSCDWIGLWPSLKEHCDERHESNVLENKCHLPRPDLTTSNLQTYVISAFQFLFLLQIKVCVASGNLFHSLRMFGDPKFLDTFSFTLDVEGNNVKFSKFSSVLPAGILAIQEPTAICTTINHLLGILNGKYDRSKFAITIQTSLNFNCVNCLTNIDFASNSKFCGECLGKLVKCKLSEERCSFRDVNSYKCWTHENMFCVNQTKCYFCGVNIVAGSFIQHLCSSTCWRRTVKSNIDSVVRVTPNTTSNYDFILFLDNNFGSVVCESYLHSSKFYQYLYTSLPSHEMKKLKCSIELTDPQTKHTRLVIPQIICNGYYDWYFYETMNNFPSIDKNIGIDMKLNIDKI